jgi:hypothetical protein
MRSTPRRLPCAVLVVIGALGLPLVASAHVLDRPVERLGSPLAPPLQIQLVRSPVAQRDTGAPSTRPGTASCEPWCDVVLDGRPRRPIDEASPWFSSAVEAEESLPIFRETVTTPRLVVRVIDHDDPWGAPSRQPVLDVASEVRTVRGVRRTLDTEDPWAAPGEVMASYDRAIVTLSRRTHAIDRADPWAPPAPSKNSSASPEALARDAVKAAIDVGDLDLAERLLKALRRPTP